MKISFCQENAALLNFSFKSGKLEQNRQNEATPLSFDPQNRKNEAFILE